MTDVNSIGPLPGSQLLLSVSGAPPLERVAFQRCNASGIVAAIFETLR
jgi:hypothetical protein